MGPATAVILDGFSDEVQTGFLNTPIVKLCSAAKDKECAQSVVDVVAEIGFAANPIYADFPAFWHVTVKEGERIALAQPRSAEQDAAFRKRVPAAGSVKLTSAALQAVHNFAAAVRSEDGSKCQIMASRGDLGLAKGGEKGRRIPNGRRPGRG